MRLDVYVLENFNAKSKSYAQELIKNSLVKVDGAIVTKCGFMVKPGVSIELIDELFTYVSRSGLKLQQAIKEFSIDVSNKVVIDVGSSTGGFTDYCLEAGASKVYCIDVGTDQLSEKLRIDDRVIVMENTDIRSVVKSNFSDSIDLIVVDVSFISICLILPKLFELADSNCDIIILIKPQFEVGQKNLNKHGVVNNQKAVKESITRIYDQVSYSNFIVKNFSKTDLIGKKGNQEYLMLVCRTKEGEKNLESIIKRL